jgi:hypothetical protein
MQLISVNIEKPEAVNFILGQTHFIKSVEDIHEALIGHGSYGRCERFAPA